MQRQTGLAVSSLKHRFLRCKLMLYKSHCRPQLDYIKSISSNILRVRCVTREKVQLEFTGKLVGQTSSPIYKERCEQRHLNPFWLRRIKLNLTCFLKLLSSKTYTAGSLIGFANECSYRLRKRPLPLGMPPSKLSFRSKAFTVA